ncbi:hypothetical protein ACP275_04G159500 [Erythranthe tilingii]
MGGIGKTTLAKNAYEHSLILHHFDIRTWVTVSKKYNVEHLVLQLLSRISSEINGEDDEQLLKQKLHKILWGRRYLIVIDDIWSVEAWEEVSRFFPDNNNGSRIVVTTRISNVATYIDSLCLELSFLDEDKSWKLFCEKAFGQVGCPSELEDIGKEIVKKCKGLPLSVSVIGGHLGRSHVEQQYWRYIAKYLTSILDSGRADQNCLSILSLSYTYLPVHLKPCFLYMLIYPEDHEIRVSRLIKLWVAEGFTKSNDSQSLEEIARGYLNDLIDRNLILKHRVGSTGKVKTCKIHDLLRDLCLRIAKKDNFMRMVEDDLLPWRKMKRRLICNEESQSHFQYYAYVRTLVTSIDGRYFSNRLLRVMSFNVIKVVRNSSFSSFFNIEKDNELRWSTVDHVNMRYLAYNDAYITYIPPSPIKLPSSIGVLWNLQTIIIMKKIEVPPEIWKMRQLRHVGIWELHLPNPPQSGDQQQDEIVLQNLQTLKNVRNFVWSEEACKRVVGVRKLRIKHDNDSKRSKKGYLLYNICRLHKLESLTCVSVSKDYLWDKLTFPSSLKKLYLQGMKFHWEDLTVIGSLPNLEVLKLRLGLVRETVWNPVEGEFLRLKFLLVQWCNLVNWNAESSHFPVLEKLFLEYMEELEGIPLDIGEIPTLELIELKRCTESTAISAMRIAEEQENNGNEELRVRVLVKGHGELKSIREKVTQSATNFTVDLAPDES